ncbi:DNA-binding transcriptional LysR family regulator [Streptosporangium album]|uniref:DNA-binding transcriptional LysR family regulator n=1 Tax=Streptosporangium album TaxID=47479 RepID=A0A7W7WE91_9ACTN|nr:LysR family transcriptional regulator [Streptosporangium album]MBB4943200.1 DNA-binding transcriptional LysR family regulator [Streptosporangium album]
MTHEDLTAGELRILAAVERERSFSAAAIRLGLTQSAVSYAVRAAERKIGMVLFQRGRNGARPTAAGTAAVGHARRILRLMDVMRAEAHAASTGETTGNIKVAAFRSAAFHLLPMVLARFARRYPKVTVDVRIVQEIGRGIAGEVLEGRADLGIVTFPSRVAGLVGRDLFAEPYVLAYPAGHPDPRSLPMIDWHENCSVETKRWLDRQAWIPPSDIQVEDDGVVLSMVGYGLGSAIVPRLTLVDAPPKVAMEELDAAPPIRRVGYVTTSEMANSAVVRELVGELRAHCAKRFAAVG